MSINPFEGTEFAASWQLQGVLAVLSAPDVEHSAPLVVQDAMRREGWWHGKVRLDFDSAASQSPTQTYSSWPPPPNPDRR
jgi:hypothetical protein